MPGFLQAGRAVVEAQRREETLVDVAGDGARGTQPGQTRQPHGVDLTPVVALEPHVGAQGVGVAEGFHAVGAEEHAALCKGEKTRTVRTWTCERKACT